MRKKKNKDFIEMDVDPILLDDELDVNKEEDLPDENPELTQSMIGGEVEAKKQVQDLYKSLKFVYGKYDPNYARPIHRFIFHIIPIIVLVATYIFGIKAAVQKDFSIVLGLLMIGTTILFIIVLCVLRKTEKLVWWWKEKGKTITIYKDIKKNGKGDIVVYVNSNYMWQYSYKTQQWMSNELIVMGSRLLFNKLTGELRIKKLKNGKTEIGAYKQRLLEEKWGNKKYKDTKIVLENGTPIYIDYWSERGSDGESVNSQRFNFYEINTDRSVGIPRSFLDFCDENCIEPLKESKHLYFE